MVEDQEYLNVIEIDGKQLLAVKPLDANRLLIDASRLEFLDIEKNPEGGVKSISFEGKVSIFLEDKLSIKFGNVESPYYVKMMVVDELKKNVIIFSSLPNKTSSFLTPLVNMTKLQMKYDSYFVNAFLQSDLNHICLLYRSTGTCQFNEFEDSIQKEKQYEKHFKFDPYHIMYKFRIPDHFRKDIEFFLDGKYSHFSSNLKASITNFYGKDTIVYQVIYKDRTLKETIEKDLDVKLDEDMELASKPILEQEIIEL